MENIHVNPRRVDGEPLRVFDHLGRLIKFSEMGTRVNKTTFYSRLVKSGDLEIVDPKKQPTPKATPTGKTGKKMEVK